MAPTLEGAPLLTLEATTDFWKIPCPPVGIGWCAVSCTTAELLMLFLNSVHNLELSHTLDPKHSTMTCYANLSCFRP